MLINVMRLAFIIESTLWCHFIASPVLHDRCLLCFVLTITLGLFCCLHKIYGVLLDKVLFYCSGSLTSMMAYVATKQINITFDQLKNTFSHSYLNHCKCNDNVRRIIYIKSIWYSIYRFKCIMEKNEQIDLSKRPMFVFICVCRS